VPSHVLFNLASLVLGSLASCMDGPLSARAFWVLANGSGSSHVYGPREAAIDRGQHVPIDDASGHRFEEVGMRDRVEVFRQQRQQRPCSTGIGKSGRSAGSGRSWKGQSTRSLPSNPLRGSKNREAATGRERTAIARWRNSSLESKSRQPPLGPGWTRVRQMAFFGDGSAGKPSTVVRAVLA
jgi:hypothetical protein